ncbi:hypothetical protein HAN_1g18 (nucleomorph) [Hemiselmis andersenii]|uniref:Nuclease associated modular domain-containing protein n=1 Tax=Hemiselmis andersenii TaxID=464988 RepID=A9BK33_HEMAN|nr:hypothetical protein HAN_1g18 [Hemiselmis andersenii]ABW97866.1 hypothetical protein HAN_1g18 [Hemiselmis andersenii]|mmetsp:Transcript_18097/g.41925  ORF Transcript_18097/g.41925 Transcript_18097/m.41925 type:complete len:155 (-) Transcript_18097:2634-3098(-)
MLNFLLNLSFKKKNFLGQISKMCNFFSENSPENRYYRTFQHRAKLSFCLKNRKLDKKHKDSINFSMLKRGSVSVLTRQKISLANKGRKKTEKVCQKIKSSLKNRRLTKHHKKKIKEKLTGKNNPMFGKKHSKNTKRKISNKLIQKKDKIERKGN